MGGRLAEVLAGQRAPGCYRWPSRAHPSALRRDLTAAGWTLHQIDGRAVTGPAALFDRYAEALAFPAWFRHTWESLAACLADLSWLPGEGHVLLWDQYGVLAQRDPVAWRAACRVLSDVAASRRGAGTAPFFVLLRGGGPATCPHDGTLIPFLR